MTSKENQTTCSKKATKSKYVSFRVTESDIKAIKAIRQHYKNEGVNLNMSGIIRDVVLNFPIV